MAIGTGSVNHLTLDRLSSGELSCETFMQDTYDRIKRINPQLNALVNLIDEDQALTQARLADETPQDKRGPLHGLPWAAKDMVEVRGFANTWGFAPWADRMATQDDRQAARLRQAGVIFIGRSNMPEFGLGSNTFNSLFGQTLNPWNTQCTPGGSSGGAAVALATRMLPLADGSDMGGSLRNPASFCNVVGLRPSIGRVAHGPGMSWLARLSTTGPMATNVTDLCKLLAVQAGPDASDPLTLPEPGSLFLDCPETPANLHTQRIAYSPNLGNLPIDPAVTAVTDACARTLEEMGAQVEHAAPNLEGAMDIFQTQRAASLAGMGRALDKTLPEWRQHAKETAVWNIEQGFKLDAGQLLASEQKRSDLYRRVAEFFTEYDALILPAAQVPPFSVDQEWVDEIAGQKMETYIDWMTICCAITVTGCPAISIPGGFTSSGLPVGLQIVGRPRGDFELLQLAYAFEQATLHYQQLPAIHGLTQTQP